MIRNGSSLIERRKYGLRHRKSSDWAKMLRVARKLDVAGRDAGNRALGRGGERLLPEQHFRERDGRAMLGKCNFSNMTQ